MELICQEFSGTPPLSEIDPQSSLLTGFEYQDRGGASIDVLLKDYEALHSTNFVQGDMFSSTGVFLQGIDCSSNFVSRIYQEETHTFPSYTVIDSNIKVPASRRRCICFCGKELLIKNHKDHMKTHDPTRKKEFVCGECGKLFFHKRDMEEHQREIHGYELKLCKRRRHQIV